MNGVALEDVNSCGIDTQSIDTPYLKNVSKNLGPIFERWVNPKRSSRHIVQL